MADYERLRELAEKARRGPHWKGQDHVAFAMARETLHAAVTPQTILSLLAEMDALKAERAEMVEALTEASEIIERHTLYEASAVTALLSRIQTPPEASGPADAEQSDPQPMKG